MNAELRLLQFSDPHLYANPLATLRGINTLTSLERTLAYARGHIAAADALLVSGDIVNDEPDGYTHFRRVFSAFGKRVLCIPGNHDDGARLRAALSGTPFQVGGHADLGAWRLVLLDTCKPGEAAGHLNQHELERLEQGLATAGDRPVLICMHHHPVSMSSPWLDAVGLENAAEFFEVIDRHANVRVITWGHVHQCFDGRRKGVRLLATPSTGAQFQPLSREFTLDQRPPGYRRMILRADGTADTEVIWVEAASLTAKVSNDA
jgi:Icc protein